MLDTSVVAVDSWCEINLSFTRGIFYRSPHNLQLQLFQLDMFLNALAIAADLTVDAR